MEDSYLFRLYCNGFTSGFKKIDKIIKRENIAPFVEDLQKYIKLYTDQLDSIHDYLLAEDKKSFDYIDFLVDIGIREGAIVRGELYSKEITFHKTQTKKTGRKSRQQTLPEMLSSSVIEKPENLITRIENFLKIKNSNWDIACLKIALEELHYIYSCEVRTFRDALEKQYGNTIRITSEREIRMFTKNYMSLW